MFKFKWNNLLLSEVFEESKKAMEYKMKSWSFGVSSWDSKNWRKGWEGLKFGSAAVHFVRIYKREARKVPSLSIWDLTNAKNFDRMRFSINPMNFDLKTSAFPEGT